MASSIQYMQRALTLALRGKFTARPNPCVGAVLVKDNQIVGEGYHPYYGGDHAEVMAIKHAGEHARGATCYVTLEPCAHHGKTPPCIDALIAAGVARVVIACLDPNPLVNGQGMKALLKAGIDIEVGLLAINAQRLNAGFFRRIQGHRPRVILKSAMSLDGRTAMATGESEWITGEPARAEVQRLRAQCDAVITGRGTVQTDDPSLNVRDESITGLPNFKQPKRVVLDSHGKITHAKLQTLPGESWHVTTGAASHWENHVVLAAQAEKVSLPALITWLGAMPCNQVLVEAGASLAAEFLKAGLVDEWHVFIAPKLMGSQARPLCDLSLDSMAQTYGLKLMSVKVVGDDMYCIFNTV